jgi:2-polyprenyl-6-methoxyphenol hydroxylase-like FAD-dependent oxidoreductase
MLDAELPEVRDALLAAGAARIDPLQRLPPNVTDRSPRPGDDRLTTITARRPVVEHVFARAAEAEPRVEVRRGTAVTGLTSRDANGAPHVTGVRTESGEEIAADLVVDAGGRRSALGRWLEEAGATPFEEEAEDSGFIYYSRFFGPSNGGGMPAPRAPLLSPLGTFSVLTLPGDSGTWSVTLYFAAGDRPLKALRDPDRWTAVMQACPLHAHWLEGVPLGGVEALGGIQDRRRRMVSGGEPVATGVAAVADAWACTNPSLGRGIALGLAHTSLLRDVVREHLDSPRELALAWDDVTERELTPWYEATVAVDRARLTEMEALRNGHAPPAASDMPSRLRDGLPMAMSCDADAFRAGLEIAGCLTLPREVFSRPGLAERILGIAGERGAAALPAPSREQLVALAAA